jgi:hypothetical protein
MSKYAAIAKLWFRTEELHLVKNDENHILCTTKGDTFLRELHFSGDESLL